MHHAEAVHVGHRSGQLLSQADQIVHREWLNHLRQAFSATIRERDGPWIARFIEYPATPVAPRNRSRKASSC